MGLCTDTGLIFLDRVRSAIGPTSGCGCLVHRRGKSLFRCFSTLDGGALGVDSCKVIGNGMTGDPSLGIQVTLSAPKVLDKSNICLLCNRGSTAWGTLFGSCARILYFSPLQPCRASRNSVIAFNCASQATVGDLFQDARKSMHTVKVSIVRCEGRLGDVVVSKFNCI